MNIQLTEQLNTANQIITAAYNDCFIPASRIRRTAETDDLSKRKWAKRILLILIAGLYTLYIINADSGEDHPILFFLETGACLYGYFAKLKPFLKDKYSRAALNEADELDARGIHQEYHNIRL